MWEQLFDISEIWDNAILLFRKSFLLLPALYGSITKSEMSSAFIGRGFHSLFSVVQSTTGTLNDGDLTLLNTESFHLAFYKCSILSLIGPYFKVFSRLANLLHFPDCAIRSVRRHCPVYISALLCAYSRKIKFFRHYIFLIAFIVILWYVVF